MSMTFWVSTPAWTCRVDVDDAGVIQPTTARYLKSAVGQRWETWLNVARRRYKETLRVEVLEDKS